MHAQITNIRVVKEAMSEAAYLYAELVDMGAGMRVIDCGGGLGIDYDGSNTDAPASLSYTMQVIPNSHYTPAAMSSRYLSSPVARVMID